MLQITKSNTNDLEALGKLQYKDYMESEPFNGQYPWKGFCFVIKKNGVIVAGANLGATINPKNAEAENCSVMFIHSLFISSSLDALMVYVAMLRKIKTIALEAGAKTIWTLQTDYQIAQALQKLGFEEFGLLSDAPVKGLNIHHLACKSIDLLLRGIDAASLTQSEQFLVTEGSKEDSLWLRSEQVKTYLPWPPHEETLAIKPLGFVIKDDAGQVVAGISGSFTNQETFFLHYWFVSKELRGQGLGQDLLQKLIDEVSSVYEATRLIYCFTVNPVALAGYHKAGFQTYAQLGDNPLLGMNTTFLSYKLGD